MNHSDFTFSSVVDWIELEFVTANTTNAPTIRRRCGISDFIAPINAESSGAATVFRTRVQAPQSWQDVEARILMIGKQFPLQSAPTISGIEVSFDARRKPAATHEDLADLAARFYKFSTFVSSKNHRYEGAFLGGVNGITGGFEAIRENIRQGRVIAIGSQKSGRHGKHDPISQRIYLKATDNNGQQLPESEHRARIEVTLQDDGLPNPSIDFWATFDFTTLTDQFRFRKIKPGLSISDQLVADRMPQIGARNTRNRKEGGTRVYGRLTSADTILNKRSKDALRRLTTRWCKTPSLAEISAQVRTKTPETTGDQSPTLITTFTSPSSPLPGLNDDHQEREKEMPPSPTAMGPLTFRPDNKQHALGIVEHKVLMMNGQSSIQTTQRNPYMRAGPKRQQEGG